MPCVRWKMSAKKIMYALVLMRFICINIIQFFSIPSKLWRCYYNLDFFQQLIIKTIDYNVNNLILL